MNDRLGEQGYVARAASGTPAPPTTEQRDDVVARLRDAVGAGTLDLDELETRLDVAVRARTTAELARLTADLPVPASTAGATPAVPSAAWAGLGNGVFQIHAVVWALTSLFLMGVWALAGGGYFWPFFPMVGWGIGLGAHYVVASRHEQRKLRRRTRRELEGSNDAARRRPPRPGRRYVAAMFVDVVGSTTLNEAIGDDGWSRLRARHRAVLGEVFSAHDGEEVNVAGDGVLARFDDPVDATRAAVDIQRRLAADREHRDLTPSVRIGVHCGDVVDEGDDVVGTVVNLASRVTAAAAPDEIMVTEHVADVVAPAVSLEDCGLRALKGIDRPRHLFRVDWR